MAGQGCDAMRRAALQQQHQLLLCSGRGAGQGPEPTNNRVLFVIGVTLKPLPWPLVAVLGRRGGGGGGGGTERGEFYLEPGRHVAPVPCGQYYGVELLLLAVREPDPAPGDLLHCSHYLAIMFRISNSPLVVGSV
jgi:hypothetical protein